MTIISYLIAATGIYSSIIIDLLLRIKINNMLSFNSDHQENITESENLYRYNYNIIAMAIITYYYYSVTIVLQNTSLRKMFKIVLYFLILDLKIVSSEGFDPIPTCSACPQRTWAVQYTYKSGETSGCVCAGILSGEGHYGGSCRVSQTTDGVDINVQLHIGYCMTQDEGSNITYTGTCPYNNLPFHNNINVTDEVDLPQNVALLNNFMCNSSIVENNYLTVTVCGQRRRKGILCGECENGLGPAVMSYTHPCVECKWYGLLLYLILSFIPATISCFLIIILRINILSPPLNAVVFICQVVTSLVNLLPCSFLFYVNVHHASSLILPILTLYGLFNMDFLSMQFPRFALVLQCLHSLPLLWITLLLFILWLL